MKYDLQKNRVIFLIPGRKELRVIVTKGKIWLTKESDFKDRILIDGDTIALKDCGKVGIQAISDSHIVLNGNKFSLHEIIRENDVMRINKLNIRQTDKPFRPLGLLRSLG